MKRSEMLEIIKRQWQDSTSFPSDDSVAKSILDAIEKAGMLPPPMYGTVEVESTEEGLAVKIWGWEKEE
jgi:hypothetical protein